MHDEQAARADPQSIHGWAERMQWIVRPSRVSLARNAARVLHEITILRDASAASSAINIQKIGDTE